MFEGYSEDHYLFVTKFSSIGRFVYPYYLEAKLLLDYYPIILFLSNDIFSATSSSNLLIY